MLEDHLESAMTRRRLRSVQALLAAGTKKSEIARQLGIARSTVYEAVRLLEVNADG